MIKRHHFSPQVNKARVAVARSRASHWIRSSLLALLILFPIQAFAADYPINSPVLKRQLEEFYSGRSHQIAILKAKKHSAYKRAPETASQQAIPSTTFNKPAVPKYGSPEANKFLKENGLYNKLPEQHRVQRYTIETPEGALYNSLTHYYDEVQKRVLKRTQFDGLYGEEKREVYAKLGIQDGPRDPLRFLAASKARDAELKRRQALINAVTLQKRAVRHMRLGIPSGGVGINAAQQPPEDLDAVFVGLVR